MIQTNKCYILKLFRVILYQVIHKSYKNFAKMDCDRKFICLMTNVYENILIQINKMILNMHWNIVTTNIMYISLHIHYSTTHTCIQLFMLLIRNKNTN